GLETGLRPITTQTPCQSFLFHQINGLHVYFADVPDPDITPAIQSRGRDRAESAQWCGAKGCNGGVTPARRALQWVPGRLAVSLCGRRGGAPDDGTGHAGTAAAGVGGADLRIGAAHGPGAGMAGLPAAAGRLDRAAEARAGGHAELAAGTGPAAVRGIPDLPRVRAAEDPAPSP